MIQKVKTKSVTRIKTLFRISGIFTLGMILWTTLGFLMGRVSFAYVKWICAGSIVLYLVLGFIKNHRERQNFREFLELQRQDPEVQEKLRKEKTGPGEKSHGSGTAYAFRQKKSGIDWMPANIHGSVPARKKRRSFLSGGPKS